MNRVLALLVGSLLAGCAQRAATPPPGPAHLPAEFLHAEYQRDSAQFSASTRNDRGIDVQLYELKGRFDWQRLRLVAETRIELTVVADRLDAIVLDNHTDVKEVIGPAGSVAFTNRDGELTIALSARRGESLALTVRYEADAGHPPHATGPALNAVTPRAGDPVPSRVAATLSEPLGAADWMPCHNRPDDRARFAAEFRMAADENLIANGDLRIDETKGDVHTMRYTTRYTLPTYLMAFAVGQMDRQSALHGRLPIAVWARRGLPHDARGMLRALDHMLGVYEGLLTPFPFEKYAMVLLPEYTGGIEHAGITFQGETTSTQGDLTHDYWLTAHELGHQWFGDWVTIKNWDELWIKEGLATLLASEATRLHSDRNGSGHLVADQFSLVDGEAIRDPALPPEEKYNSGPYGRSAWTLTQVRALVGEQAFWGALRSILLRHAQSAIGVDELVAAFEPALGKAAADRWRRALAAKKLPRLEDKAQSLGTHELTVTDAEGALLAPLEASWYRNEFDISVAKLEPARPFQWSEADSRLLVVDPRNVHPWLAFPSGVTTAKTLGTRLVPRTDAQRKLFATLAGSVQELALKYGDGWRLDPSSFRALLGGLASEEAKYRAIRVGCDTAAGTTGGTQAAWKGALRTALGAPPFFGLPYVLDDSGLSHCRATIGDDFLAPIWDGIASNPRDARWNPTLLDFAMVISADTRTIFAAGSKLATEAGSVRVRRIGYAQLARHLRGNLPKPPAGEIAEWARFLRERLDDIAASELVQPVLDGIEAAGDRQALPALARLVGRTGVRLQRRAVCVGARVSEGDAPSWDAFRKAIGDPSRLPDSVRAVLEHPTKC